MKTADGLGIVEKSGSWWYYNELKLGQGMDNSCEFLNKNIEIFNEIENKIKENYNYGSTHMKGSTQQLKEESEDKDDEVEIPLNKNEDFILNAYSDGDKEATI